MAPTTKSPQLKKKRNRRSNRRNNKKHGQNVERNGTKMIGPRRSARLAKMAIMGEEQEYRPILEQAEKTKAPIEKKKNIDTDFEKANMSRLAGFMKPKQFIDIEKTMEELKKYKIFKKNKRVFGNQSENVWNNIRLATEVFVQTVVGEDLLGDLRKSEKGCKILLKFVDEFKAVFWDFRAELEGFKNIIAAIDFMLRFGKSLGFDSYIIKDFFTCPSKRFLPVIGISKSKHSLDLYQLFRKMLEQLPEKWREFGDNVDGNTFHKLLLAHFSILVESVIGTVNTIMNYDVESHSTYFTGCSLVFHGPNKTKRRAYSHHNFDRTQPISRIPFETSAVTSHYLPANQYQNVCESEEFQSYRGIWKNSTDFGANARSWRSDAGFEDGVKEEFETKPDIRLLKKGSSTKNRQILATEVLTEKKSNSVKNNGKILPNSESNSWIKREICD